MMNPTIGILTISDTRTLATDASGLMIETLALENNLPVKKRQVVPDDRELIQQALAMMPADFCDVLITNGGTGIAKRDVTFEAVEPLLQQELPGFGELFRYLSFKEIGSHALASRAIAGFTHQEQLLFTLPGSTGACRLAMNQLILPEIRHLIKERRK